MEIMNLLIIALLISGLITYLFYLLRKKPNTVKKDRDSENARLYSIPVLVEYTKVKINEFVTTSLIDLGLSGEEYERRLAIVTELRNAMKNAISGDLQEKIYLKQYIYDLLERNYGINESNINWIIPFDQAERLTEQDQFDILMQHFKKEHGYKALSHMIEKYKLAKPKYVIEDGQTESYIITGEEIRMIYKKEIRTLDFKDKLNVVVQRVYQQYKGFGVLDEIRDMSIDGVSGGVSGAPSKMKSVEHEVEFVGNMRNTKKGINSVWIFYKGKSIHMSFLSFENDLELKRVCQNIYKYNNPGPLTESTGYIVNDMKDGSRVVVVRPPFAETWAFWVRKFDLPNMDLEYLIPDKYDNAILARKMLRFLMQGAQTSAFTGKQGSGKTSSMMASMKFMYATLNLRIVELIFELNLRQLYSFRNIMTFRELKDIPIQEALNLTKKTDGDVNILGEVASQEVASLMIQMTQAASLFTLFSHHASTTNDLIKWHRDALLQTGAFNNERIAEETVAKAIKWDIHYERDEAGNRYIERITEITLVQYDNSFFDNEDD
ncbi:ATPase, T2SS/T4P/T4SS family, partial [Brevibacillus reuszeri]|uniref:ATPase, T2SS/T4P/T4SS family n=1 Tax=Brevibacillus reuszeri TaxID=54915 RepID=UPI000CCBEF56